MGHYKGCPYRQLVYNGKGYFSEGGYREGMPLEGHLLGRYRLLRLIGSGGMGEVYVAEDPGVQRQVAVKVMRTEIATSPETETAKRATRLFQREAQAVAQLDHPFILPLYDYGEQKVNGMTFTYLVMPYRQEGSLAHWLHQHGSSNVLSLQDIAYIVQQAASALQYAHDRQIIHQDVKPTNFLVRSNNDSPARPDLLLTDFGIAKLDTFTTSMSQNVRGTPAYMAPEQCEGQSVPASDQYALAVMVYELLTGRPPFQGNAMQIMYAHVHIPPHPPSHLNARLPAALDGVLLRALAKKPEDRYPSISAFATAFQQALQGADTSSPLSLTLSVVATPQGSMVPSLRIAEVGEQEPAHPASPVPAERRATSRNGTAPPHRRERPIVERQPQSSLGAILWVVGLVLLLVLGSGLLYYVARFISHSGPPHSATATPNAQTTSGVTHDAQATAVADAHATATATVFAAQGMMFGFDAQHTNSNPYETLLSRTNVSHLVPKWISDPTGGLSSSPAIVVGGLVYIGSNDGKLYAFDVTTGHTRWIGSTSGLNLASPAVVNGVAYVGSLDQKLYAFDALTGNVRWTTSIPGSAISSSPTVANGVVYVGTEDGRVCAFDVATGRTLWTSDSFGSHGSAPAVANGMVYIGETVGGAGKGRVYAFDAATGQNRWVSELVDGGIDINSSPTVAKGMVYIGTGLGGLAAFDAATGHIRWVTPLTAGSTGSSPAVANGIVYFSSDRLYAFDAATGQTRWSTNAIGAYNADSPLVANGVVYVGSAGGKNVYALDATTGSILWTSPPTAGQIFSAPAVVNGGVYVGSDDGKVYAFSLSGNQK
jgi:serine/threonine protein kinase/outer membrane protein assembly factor BamB